jgi:cytochrome c-type biogenesis protein CcmH/NrfG
MSLLALLPLLVLAAPARPARPLEAPAARAAARLCEERAGEEGLLACRRAIELGLSTERLDAVRELLSRKLVDLERWPELVRHLREEVALHPSHAEGQLRLGAALLFTADQPEEAIDPLRESIRLDPDRAPAQATLGVALGALGRFEEAVAAFRAAERVDPAIFDRQPAARAVYEAAQKAARWP